MTELRTLKDISGEFVPGGFLRKNPKVIVKEVLKQTDLNPMPFEKQVVVLYTALNEYFDNLELSRLKQTEEKFLEYMENFGKEVLDEIKSTKDLAESAEQKLKTVIEEFLKKNI